MKRFGVLCAALVCSGLFSGCGAAPQADQGNQDARLDQTNGPGGDVGQGVGQGVGRFGDTSRVLNDPNWGDNGLLYGPDGLPIEPVHRISFDLNSSVIGDESARILKGNAAWIRLKSPSGTVTVEGHCDERGTREFNLALGQQRADAVRQFLIAHGVPSHRLESVSYGKERPLIQGHDEQAWRENRRGEIILP